MHRVRFSSLVATVMCSVVWVMLLFPPPVGAQDKARAGQPGVAVVPSFTCGVCDGGYTPLNGASWQLCWRQAPNQGLVIQHACFKGQTVLYQASQPFVIVPYHNYSAQFKDGLGATCGGVPYALITPTVATLSADEENPGYPASSGFPAGPAYDKLELAATYDTYNY